MVLLDNCIQSNTHIILLYPYLSNKIFLFGVLPNIFPIFSFLYEIYTKRLT